MWVMTLILTVQKRDAIYFLAPKSQNKCRDRDTFANITAHDSAADRASTKRCHIPGTISARGVKVRKNSTEKSYTILPPLLATFFLLSL